MKEYEYKFVVPKLIPGADAKEQAKAGEQEKNSWQQKAGSCGQPPAVCWCTRGKWRHSEAATAGTAVTGWKNNFNFKN